MGPSVRPPPPTGNERWTTYLTKRPPSAARQRAACERLAAPWRHKRVDGSHADGPGREAHTPRPPHPVSHPPVSPALEQRRCREPTTSREARAAAAPSGGVLRPVLEAFNRADARLGALTGSSPSNPPSSQVRPPPAPQQRRSASLHAASRGAPQSTGQATGASIVASQGQQTPRGAATPLTPRPPGPGYPVPQAATPRQAAAGFSQELSSEGPSGRLPPTPARGGSRTPPFPPDSAAVVPPLKVPPSMPGTTGAGGPTPRRTAREQRAACERLSVPRSRPDRDGENRRERPQSPATSKRPGRGGPMQGRVPRLMRRLNESASWLSEDGSGGSEDEEGSGDEDRKQALPANVRQMFCLHEMLNESATWIPCDVSESGEDESPSPRQEQDIYSDNVFVGNHDHGRARSASF